MVTCCGSSGSNCSYTVIGGLTPISNTGVYAVTASNNYPGVG